MAVWHTPETARAQWTGAPSNSAELQAFLDAAKRQCIAYAPPITNTDGTLPEGFEIAQLMRARDLWNAGHTAPQTENMFSGDVQVRVYSMSQEVKGLLRPMRASIGLG